MHDIEPFFRWRDTYTAETDRQSPFYGRTYSEFRFTHRLYNFYLHPQWDEFGSSTLYGKLLYTDYEEQCALIELIGEWNDALHNDIMYLKRNLVDPLMKEGIYKFVFFCEHVLNFHAAMEDDYYAEWYEETRDEDGWIVLVNTRQHVMEEMYEGNMDRYALLGPEYNDLKWQTQRPLVVYQLVNEMVNGRIKRLD